MSKVVVYSHNDGFVEILHPTIRKQEDENEEDFLKKVSQGSFPYRPFKIVEDLNLIYKGHNLTKEFRTAIVLKEDRLDFDMDKCKSIWIDRIRKHRNEQLKELDIEFMKCVENNDTQSIKEIAELKKLLRNLPQEFSKLKIENIFQLKSTWPVILQPVPNFVLVP